MSAGSANRCATGADRMSAPWQGERDFYSLDLMMCDFPPLIRGLGVSVVHPYFESRIVMGVIDGGTIVAGSVEEINQLIIDLELMEA